MTTKLIVGNGGSSMFGGRCELTIESVDENPADAEHFNVFAEHWGLEEDDPELVWELLRESIDEADAVACAEAAALPHSLR